MEEVDEYFSRAVRAWRAEPEPHPGPPARASVGAEALRELFAAQLESRHVDFAARWLQSVGKGYYTIGSAGHEGNAALGLVTRPDDPALLHYRSGAFYAARATRAGRTDSVRDVLLSLTCSSRDPISGGRHKVFGHPDLHIIPQTSTIGSHLPRAVGLAYSLDLARDLHRPTPWPEDAIVVCSFGDASVNHSTVTGALNAASYLAHRRMACPVLLVCEDNRLGISTPSPSRWPEAMLESLPGVTYVRAYGADAESLLERTTEAVGLVRATRRPAVLHLDAVRLMGHAGSDVEAAYRSRREIVQDYEKDPLLGTARCLLAEGHASADQILEWYEEVRVRVMAEAERVLDDPHLSSLVEVMAPLALPETSPGDRTGRVATFPDARRGALPESGSSLTLAQSINTTLAELMDQHPEMLVFGEDVAVKGGVYGVTRGLRRRFGGHRVFDTLLDEQTILGLALGSALAGFVPVPEIQYLAYLHNAEDQLRGEAASLRFFSNGQYRNGMVVRVAGLAYQRGFGGHFHNDNSVAVLRDIPGLVLVVPSHPADAPGILRTCVALAEEGRVCVVLEPIALYHTRDLLDDDGGWTAPFSSVDRHDAAVPLGQVASYGDGRDVLLVTFGNGVPMSLRAQSRLAERGVASTVVDLRWLAPLPVQVISDLAVGFPAVLVVDETRKSGGVAEGVVTGLVEGGYAGHVARVTSADTFVPLGPAAATVLLSEDDVVAAAVRVARPAEGV